VKKNDLLKKYIYFGTLSVFVFFNADLSTMRLLVIGGMNVYYGDLFFLLISAVVVLVIAKKGMGLHWAQPATAWYMAFLAWLVLEVFWGWRVYGYRAFGESRYVLPFFAFFVPYLMLGRKRRDDPAAVGDLARTTTWVAAAASFLFLICSLLYRKPFYFSALNLRNQKLWFHKIIGSDQSFHIILLAMFIFYLSFFRGKFLSLPKIVFFLLLGIVLPVYNRTALISLFAALLVLLALGKKIGEILFVCASVAFIIILMQAIPNIEQFYYPFASHQPATGPIQKKMAAENLGQSIGQPPGGHYNVITPATIQHYDYPVPSRPQRQRKPKITADHIVSLETGYWRLYQNMAAMRLVLKKPFFGQHLGGYFDFFIPETNGMNHLPPHNQYVLILLETGMFGLVLLLVPLLLLLWRLLKFLADKRLETSEKSTTWLLLLVLLSQLPYGMGFGFIPLYAIYFGFGTIFVDSLSKKYPLPLRIKKD
jgi:hypothetical protein